MKKTAKKKKKKLPIASLRRPYEKLGNDIFIHSLKHGLTAIKWSLKMILSGDFGELTEEQKKIIEKTLKENERLLLAADGPAGEKSSLSKITFDLAETAKVIIAGFQERITAKKMSVDFETPQGEVQFFGDKEKIKIAIQNILDNAIKYSYEGGKIIVRLASGESEISLHIQDFGIGVPLSQQNRMFTKFFRADNAGKTDGDGSGLGLFISKSIIDAHGGKIWFSSEEDKGTIFNISLPI